MVSLLRLVTLLALAAGAVALTMQDQIDNTNFVQGTSCYPNNNSWLVRIKNGFATPSNFQITLSYNGQTSQTFMFTLEPFENSNITSVFPVSGGVGNRLGFLNLLVSNPNFNNGVMTALRSIKVTCGAVVENQANTDCKYVNIGCLINNGWCLGNAFCWLIIYLITSIVGIVGVIFTWVVTEKYQLESFVFREASPKSKANTDDKASTSTVSRPADDDIVEQSPSTFQLQMQQRDRGVYAPGSPFV